MASYSRTAPRMRASSRPPRRPRNTNPTAAAPSTNALSSGDAAEYRSSLSFSSGGTSRSSSTASVSEPSAVSTTAAAAAASLTTPSLACSVAVTTATRSRASSRMPNRTHNLPLVDNTHVENLHDCATRRSRFAGLSCAAGRSWQLRPPARLPARCGRFRRPRPRPDGRQPAQSRSAATRRQIGGHRQFARRPPLGSALRLVRHRSSQYATRPVPGPRSARLRRPPLRSCTTRKGTVFAKKGSENTSERQWKHERKAVETREKGSGNTSERQWNTSERQWNTSERQCLYLTCRHAQRHPAVQHPVPNKGQLVRQGTC